MVRLREIRIFGKKLVYLNFNSKMVRLRANPTYEKFDGGNLFQFQNGTIMGESLKFGANFPRK